MGWDLLLDKLEKTILDFLLWFWGVRHSGGPLFWGVLFGLKLTPLLRGFEGESWGGLGVCWGISVLILGVFESLSRPNDPHRTFSTIFGSLASAMALVSRDWELSLEMRVAVCALLLGGEGLMGWLVGCYERHRVNTLWTSLIVGTIVSVLLELAPKGIGLPPLAASGFLAVMNWVLMETMRHRRIREALSGDSNRGLVDILGMAPPGGRGSFQPYDFSRGGKELVWAWRMHSHDGEKEPCSAPKSSADKEKVLGFWRCVLSDHLYKETKRSLKATSLLLRGEVEYSLGGNVLVATELLARSGLNQRGLAARLGALRFRRAIEKGVDGPKTRGLAEMLRDFRKADGVMEKCVELAEGYERLWRDPKAFDLKAELEAQRKKHRKLIRIARRPEEEKDLGVCLIMGLYWAKLRRDPSTGQIWLDRASELRRLTERMGGLGGGGLRGGLGKIREGVVMVIGGGGDLGRIIEVYGKCRGLWGYEREELLERQVEMLVPGISESEHHDLIRRFVAEGGTKSNRRPCASIAKGGKLLLVSKRFGMCPSLDNGVRLLLNCTEQHGVDGGQMQCLALFDREGLVNIASPTFGQPLNVSTLHPESLLPAFTNELDGFANTISSGLGQPLNASIHHLESLFPSLAADPGLQRLRAGETFPHHLRIVDGSLVSGNIRMGKTFLRESTGEELNYLLFEPLNPSTSQALNPSTSQPFNPSSPQPLNPSSPPSVTRLCSKKVPSSKQFSLEATITVASWLSCIIWVCLCLKVCLDLFSRFSAFPAENAFITMLSMTLTEIFFAMSVLSLNAKYFFNLFLPNALAQVILAGLAPLFGSLEVPLSLESLFAEPGFQGLEWRPARGAEAWGRQNWKDFLSQTSEEAKLIFSGLLPMDQRLNRTEGLLDSFLTSFAMNKDFRFNRVAQAVEGRLSPSTPRVGLVLALLAQAVVLVLGCLYFRRQRRGVEKSLRILRTQGPRVQNLRCEATTFAAFVQLCRSDGPAKLDANFSLQRRHQRLADLLDPSTPQPLNPQPPAPADIPCQRPAFKGFLLMLVYILIPLALLAGLFGVSYSACSRLKEFVRAQNQISRMGTDASILILLQAEQSRTSVPKEAFEELAPTLIPIIAEGVLRDFGVPDSNANFNIFLQVFSVPCKLFLAIIPIPLSFCSRNGPDYTPSLNLALLSITSLVDQVTGLPSPITSGGEAELAMDSSALILLATVSALLLWQILLEPMILDLVGKTLVACIVLVVLAVVLFPIREVVFLRGLRKENILKKEIEIFAKESNDTTEV